MNRVELDLTKPEDLQQVKAQWRFGQGMVPGQPNEGLVAQDGGSPARLSDYDDSWWEVCDSITEYRSKGFTFGWYRITLTMPEKVKGLDLRGTRMFFETCIDDYGEIWINGKCDLERGMVQGCNVPHRIYVTTAPEPGSKHVIACLAINGPMAAGSGAIFMRFARLAFESTLTGGAPGAPLKPGGPYDR